MTTCIFEMIRVRPKKIFSNRYKYRHGNPISNMLGAYSTGDAYTIGYVNAGGTPHQYVKRNRSYLVEKEAVEIFQIKMQNMGAKVTSTSVARAYGVSEKTVRDIWASRTWKKETWHLDTSIPLILKKQGRPLGSKDRTQRKIKLPPQYQAVVSGTETQATEYVRTIGYNDSLPELYDTVVVQTHTKDHAKIQKTNPDSQNPSDRSTLGLVISSSCPTIDDLLFNLECTSGMPDCAFHREWAPWKPLGGLGNLLE
jgi:hypothetical protein